MDRWRVGGEEEIKYYSGVKVLKNLDISGFK